MEMSTMPAQQEQPITLVTREGVCRYCGCTDEKGCACLCWWIDAAETVSSAPLCVRFYFEELRMGIRAALEKPTHVAALEKACQILGHDDMKLFVAINARNAGRNDD